MTETQIKDFKNKLLILFDKETFYDISAIDKVQALYEIFISPRMNNYIKGYKTMVKIVRNIDEFQELETQEEIQNYRKNSFNFIIDQYLKYLWKNSNKDLQYVYSFESWLEKNKNQWSKTLQESKEKLNLVLEEHKEIISIFNSLQEPLFEYICKRKDQENLCKNDCQKEITTNGLDGT